MRSIVVSMLAVGASCLALGAGCTAKATSFPFLADGGDAGSLVPTGDGGSTKPKKDGGKTETSDGTLCGDTCANFAKADCSKKASCQDDCETQEAEVPSACTDAFEALMKCAASDELNGCDSKGTPKLAGCKDETLEMVACLQGGGKKDGGSTGTCTLQLTTNSPACDTCLQSSCCTQANTCAGNSECMALGDCAAACTTQTCVNACKNQHPSGVAADTALVDCMSSDCSSVCGS